MQARPSPIELNPARVEALLVAALLAVTAHLAGGSFRDWSSALAVLLSFICSQIAFDMAEGPSGPCRTSFPSDNRYRRFYLMKEAWWIVTCLALGSYPLLVSTVVFATYPVWRGVIRGSGAVRPVGLQAAASSQGG